MIFQIYSVVSFKLIPIDVLGVLLHLRIPVSGVMSHMAESCSCRDIMLRCGLRHDLLDLLQKSFM